MISRFVIAVSLASVSTLTLCAQQSDVVIGSVRDGYTVRACAADGRTLLGSPHPPEWGQSTSWSPQDSHWSLLSVARDGSIVTYQLPVGLDPRSTAYDGFDLVVLAMDMHPHRVSDMPPHRVSPSGPVYEMLRFDSQGNLLRQQPVNIDFASSHMAVLPSGRTIVVGEYRDPGQDDWKRVAAVLDADGQMLKRTAFPLPPKGGGWVFDSRRMLGGDGAAYLMLHSNEPPASGLAKILEDGTIEIKIIPNAPFSDERHHNEWLFGPDVAVEMYHFVDAHERCTFHFDEYDLNTGERRKSRYAFISGGGFACYSGNEVSMTAQSAHVDPARGLAADTLRLVFGKLQDQPVSKPVENPQACSLAGIHDNCPAATASAAAKP